MTYVPQMEEARYDILPGTYISGTLFLKNNVMLFLDRGAVLRGSSDLNEYPELRTHRKGLIHAENDP